MTNKEFQQQCSRNFNRLPKERQLDILAEYVQDDLMLSGKQFQDYFKKLIEKKSPKRKEKAERMFKFLLWYHNNYMVPSWTNTHFEIITYIISFRRKKPSGVLKKIYEDETSAATPRLWDLAVEWTNEFEKQYIGYDWSENGDYYEKVEDFCDSENKKTDTYH